MPTVYITAPADDASSLAQGLVERKLAACVNRVPCHSTYRWDGEIEEDEEVILLVKTTDERYEDVVAHVVDHHPYETPCIERFDETDVLAQFADWRADSCRMEDGN